MEDVRFDDRVAVVTGAGGGLGREYALLLAGRGAKVLVNDTGSPDALLGEGRSAGPAEAVVAEIQAAGGEAVADATSVTTSKGGQAIVDTALDAWGRVDVVINNAGIVGAVGMGFADISDEDFERVLDVQLRGPFNVLRPAWRVMVDQGYGRILNISSGSVFGQGETISYPAAKAAMIGITRNLGLVGPNHGIKVNALMPIGFTRMVENLVEPLRTWVRENFPPVKVAPVAVFLVHEDVPCSGEVFSAGGGRFARVFMGETKGGIAPGPTLEQVRDLFATATDADDYTLVTNTFEELNFYAAELGLAP